MDRELARFRVKLEKKWGSEHDNTFVYIYPDGTKLPLTPHMLKEWARALVRYYSTISSNNQHSDLPFSMTESKLPLFTSHRTP